MKHTHKLLLASIALILTACSNDEPQRAEPQNCACWTILQTVSYTVPNQSPVSIMTVANDCTGLQKQMNRNGVYAVGQKICD